MENTYKIDKIGKVLSDKGMFAIQLDKEFIPGLTSIEGFQYLQIVWWGHLSDSPSKRGELVYKKPYKSGPETIGVFATRSEFRPNPILITTIYVMKVDFDEGRIYTPYIDAIPGTDVLDIKPYHCVERVKECNVPEWCSHWPAWYEEAASFDWENEFNF